MQLSAFPKGHDSHLKAARKALSISPSRGRHGAWVWIKDRYYIRTQGGRRLQALPQLLSSQLREKLEQRNRRVRLVRNGLILALVIGALVMLAGCTADEFDGRAGQSIGADLRVRTDSIRGVVCYSDRYYRETLSCVKLDAPRK